MTDDILRKFAPKRKALNKYTVEWERVEEGTRMKCTGLTTRTLVARLIKAVHLNSVVVHSVTLEK